MPVEAFFKFWQSVLQHINTVNRLHNDGIRSSESTDFVVLLEQVGSLDQRFSQVLSKCFVNLKFLRAKLLMLFEGGGSKVSADDVATIVYLVN